MVSGCGAESRVSGDPGGSERSNSCVAPQSVREWGRGCDRHRGAGPSPVRRAQGPGKDSSAVSSARFHAAPTNRLQTEFTTRTGCGQSGRRRGLAGPHEREGGGGGRGPPARPCRARRRRPGCRSCRRRPCRGQCVRAARLSGRPGHDEAFGGAGGPNRGRVGALSSGQESTL
jgi:hypothetical protein